MEGSVLLKVGNNITTDHILPAGSKVLPLRSNIPAISEHLFEGVDGDFYKRTKHLGGGFVVGGENYGQGSSREHAALAPMSIGIKAIITVSYARIHRANLINFGVLPLTFKDPHEFERVQQGDELRIVNVREALRSETSLKVENRTQQKWFEVSHGLNPREREVALAGGLLNYTRDHGAGG